MSRRLDENSPSWAKINAPKAVRPGSTAARLAAIARRQAAGLGLERLGKRDCEGQTSIFDELGEPDTDEAGRTARKAQGDLT